MRSLLFSLILILPAFSDDTIAIDAELRKEWPANRTINIVFHGHSVPSGYHLTPRVKPFESYPHLFRLKMAERYPTAVFNIITTAIGGENSVAGAARFADDVLPFKPDLIFIDYALNDRPLPIAEVDTAWRSMITSAKAANIPLILITPTGATNANFSDSTDPLTIRAELIRSIADELDVMLADVSTDWLDALTSGTDQADLLSQGNHPNLQGHQLAADTLWQTFLANLPNNQSVSAQAFPTDQSTNTFTTADSKLTFTTTNTFSGQANFLGDSGGPDNKSNSWDGDETLKINLTPDTRLTGFNVRWTISDIIITGFHSNPLATISQANGNTGNATWDEETSTLTLDLPWDNGNIRNITFQNLDASLGATLDFSFTDNTPGWQTSFTSFDYRISPSDPGASLIKPSLIFGDDSLSFVFDGKKDSQYDLVASPNLQPNSWFPLDSSGPLDLDRQIVLNDLGPLPDQRFYRIEVTSAP